MSVGHPRTRPWQHVLEPLAGYLILAETLWDRPALASAYNFGPATEEAATVRAVVDLAREAYGEGEVRWGDGTEGPHEAGWLALDIAKARAALDFEPLWTTAQAVGRTWPGIARSAMALPPARSARPRSRLTRLPLNRLTVDRSAARRPQARRAAASRRCAGVPVAAVLRG